MLRLILSERIGIDYDYDLFLTGDILLLLGYYIRCIFYGQFTWMYQ